MDWDTLQRLLENLPEGGYVEIVHRTITIESIETPQKVIDVKPVEKYKGYLTRSTTEQDNG